MFHYHNSWASFHKSRQLIVNKDKEGNILSIKQVITESNGLVTLVKVDEKDDVELRDFKDNSTIINQKK
jgi:hypothetical protein